MSNRDNDYITYSNLKKTSQLHENRNSWTIQTYEWDSSHICEKIFLKMWAWKCIFLNNLYENNVIGLKQINNNHNVCYSIITEVGRIDN